MDRSTKPYLLVHYALLIGLILVIVDLFERAGIGVPLWVGILIAISVGLAYPRVLNWLGFAPESWE